MAESVFNRRTMPIGARSYAAMLRDEWPLRWFDWPVEKGVQTKGSILFQCGRGDIVEKYLESFDHWHANGWHVSSFDWRGQGGSGRLAADPRTGHISDFGIWVDDLAECWAKWVSETPGPHFAMGHSMGGHLVLRSIIEKRIDPAGAVLVAPMLGFDTGIMPVSLVAPIVRFLARRSPEKQAWKENERPTLVNIRRQTFLTHDDTRYADELWWKNEEPDLAMGPPSLSWLAQAHASTLSTEAPGRLEGVMTPLLMIGTQGDRLVSPAAIERFAKRLPNATLKMFGPDVAHEILREVDSPRDEAMGLIDQFLDRSLPQ